MKRFLSGVVLLIMVLNGLEAYAMVPSEIVSLEAETDLWVREISPHEDTVWENDWVSVWGNDIRPLDLSRYGAVEFNLSGVGGQIIGAHIELYALDVDWGTRQWNSTAFSQSAFLLSPHGISSLTWNGLAAYSETPLDSLGAYDLPANSPVSRYYASDSASPADIAKLEVLRTSTEPLATFLFKPTTPTGVREWGDHESGFAPRLVLETVPEVSAISQPIINPANGHSYVLLGSASWSASENEAMALGGHLVTINDATENQWVFDTFASFGGVSRDLWIGLTDSASEGDFVWVNGEPVVFTNWQNLQPDDYRSSEDYAQMYSGRANEHVPGWAPGKWNDFRDEASYVSSSGTTRHLYGVVEIVPEPSALINVLLLGGLGIVATLRRKRKAA